MKVDAELDLIRQSGVLKDREKLGVLQWSEMRAADVAIIKGKSCIPTFSRMGSKIQMMARASKKRLSLNPSLPKPAASAATAKVADEGAAARTNCECSWDSVTDLAEQGQVAAADGVRDDSDEDGMRSPQKVGDQACPETERSRDSPQITNHARGSVRWGRSGYLRGSIRCLSVRGSTFDASGRDSGECRRSGRRVSTTSISDIIADKAASKVLPESFQPEAVRYWKELDRHMRWVFPLAFFLFVIIMYSAVDAWPAADESGLAFANQCGESFVGQVA